MGLGEKKEIVKRYVSQGLRTRGAMKIAGITKHQYYYCPKQGKRGRRAGSHTVRHEGGEAVQVENNRVWKKSK